MDSLTIPEIQDGLRTKRFSAEELTRHHFDRIAARDALIGAYLYTMEDDAFATARRVDAALARGEDLSALAGVPIAVKDVICVAGHPCTAASRILEPYRAAYDATAIAKLRANDAVLLGKTNCDEFAMGSSTEHSAYRRTVNPWDPTVVPGGSSGGSAVATAADLCVAALGSDTGGSIRQPASFCGVVGLKPTYGAVSRYGLIAMASSFDTIGPMARTVADARSLFHAIRGRDERDATSSDGRATERRDGIHTRPQEDRAAVKALRIGIPKEYFGEGIDPDVERVVRDAIRVLERDLRCTIAEVSLPHTAYGLAVYYVLMPCEVSANLARFDGLRYGVSLARELQHAPLERMESETRSRGFGAEVRRRIMLGTYALSKGYADRYYTRALAVRQRIKQDFAHAFEGVDVLVTPVSPTPAWTLGAKLDDPLAMYRADVFTVSANVAGIPGISVPCGFVERNGRRLPIGLQLLGRWFDEDALCTIGEAYEQATPWHRERPIPMDGARA